MKYYVLSIILGLCVAGAAEAQEQGLGVSPAEIVVEEDMEFPYTVPITVTNFSNQEERFEVFGAQASPGRFMLEAGQSRRVAVTFDEPGQGEIRVLSRRTSAEGLNTGTGVKIPFRMSGGDSAEFLASANASSGSFPYVFGAGIILVTLFLLWQIAGIIRLWVSSNKQ